MDEGIHGQACGARVAADCLSASARRAYAGEVRIMPETKFCRHCGARIAIHAQFCNKCGKGQTASKATRPVDQAAGQTRVAQSGEEQLNESYRRSGHKVLEPFRKTVVEGVERFAGTTRHPKGYRMQIQIYVTNSCTEARSCKERLSKRYETRGYRTHKTERDQWVGVSGGTLVSIMAKKDSLFGVPTTGVISVSRS
jgi:ribosomal protein L40E